MSETPDDKASAESLKIDLSILLEDIGKVNIEQIRKVAEAQKNTLIARMEASAKANPKSTLNILMIRINFGILSESELEDLQWEANLAKENNESALALRYLLYCSKIRNG